MQYADPFTDFALPACIIYPSQVLLGYQQIPKTQPILFRIAYSF
jgi:hypothetical protein